jgi:hypothetical protein
MNVTKIMAWLVNRCFRKVKQKYEPRLEHARSGNEIECAWSPKHVDQKFIFQKLFP